MALRLLYSRGVIVTFTCSANFQVALTLSFHSNGCMPSPLYCGTTAEAETETDNVLSHATYARYWHLPFHYIQAKTVKL